MSDRLQHARQSGLLSKTKALSRASDNGCVKMLPAKWIGYSCPLTLVHARSRQGDIRNQEIDDVERVLPEKVVVDVEHPVAPNLANRAATKSIDQR